MTAETALTREDVALLRVLARGVTQLEAARALCMSTRTLRRRIDAVCRQLGVSTTIEAVVAAARRGLVLWAMNLTHCAAGTRAGRSGSAAPPAPTGRRRCGPGRR